MTDRLDEIGRAMQEWDMVDSDADEPTPIERWKRLARHLIERGLLIPRAEHEAAIAAVVEKAAQRLDADGGSDAAEWAKEIRALAPQSARDALREAKVEAVSKALDWLWELMRDDEETFTSYIAVRMWVKEWIDKVRQEGDR